MRFTFQPSALFLYILCAVFTFCILGCNSPEEYKVEADKEVYKIIDSKWQEDFGQKANYTISDVEPSENDLQVEKEVPEASVISLAEAVAIATAYNRDYQTQKEELYETALALTLERHNFARQWFGTFDSKYANEAGEESLEYDAGFGFNQLLAGGAEISVNIGLEWLRFLDGSPSTTLGSVLTASIRQPLLRGSGRRIVQEDLKQSERDVLYKIRSFNRFRKRFVVSTVTAYYGVLQQRDKVTNAENNYKRRVESKERLEMEANAGRRNRFEADQAETDVLRARDSHVRAQQSYEQKLDEFKLKLALATDAEIELDQDELKALEEIGISEIDYTLDTAVETALLRRLDLANSADSIDDAVRKIILAADDFGPKLDLVGRAGVPSKGKTDFGKSQFHRGAYELGLEADLPFDRKAERNSYRSALIDLEQQQRQYAEDEDVVKLQVRNAYRQLEEAAERYRIQKNSLELAEKRVESTSLLLQAGRLTTRDLLESQDALLEAQDSVTEALVGHTTAKLSFFRDVGILEVKPDGMWEQ
ncbi:MAG: TolC family protein [Planctomycetes bacterium]|nr:TolC family protein [Planctomycetota bacterium]